MVPSPPLIEAFSRAIWQLALILVLIGLLVVLVLVLRRLLEELRRDGLARRREVARRLILEHLRSPDAAVEADALSDLPADFLIELIDELAQMVRGEGRARLAELGRRLGLLDRLLEELRSWRPGLRLEAARRLSIYRGEEVVRALSELLFDRAVPVRIAAAIALLDHEVALPDLLRHARLDPALSRPAAFLFWQRLAEIRPESFERLFATSGPAGRRIVMLKAAGAAGLGRLAPRIAAETGSPDPEIRRAATIALLDLNHPLALDALSRMLADPEPRLRAEAVVAIGRRKLVALLGALRDRRDDPDPAVRFRAEEALLRLGARAATGGGSGGR